MGEVTWEGTRGGETGGLRYTDKNRTQGREGGRRATRKLQQQQMIFVSVVVCQAGSKNFSCLNLPQAYWVSAGIVPTLETGKLRHRDIPLHQVCKGSRIPTHAL